MIRVSVFIMMGGNHLNTSFDCMEHGLHAHMRNFIFGNDVTMTGAETGYKTEGRREVCFARL